MSDTILCPKCNFQIDVSDALAARIRGGLRLEFEAAAKAKENELAARFAMEREELLTEAKDKAAAAVELEFNDVKSQLAEAKQQLSVAQQAELQLRQDRRKLEDEKQALALTVNRQLDEERAKIREAAKRDANEEHRLLEADKDKLVADLRRQIDELKRKSEQGVPQAQGEVLELELEDILRQHFPADTIQPVRVGTHGGDVLQHVYDTSGEECGVILWESKRTKAWNDGWLPKLRNDQRVARAQVSVLMTVEMPKGMTHFGAIDGVWVTNRQCMTGLASVLRAGLLEVARTKRSAEGKQTKMDLLYSYLSSTEFSQRVEGIVEAFVTMREDLESERRSMHRIWTKREKQLDRAVVNTASLYGDLGGILGTSLPQIGGLELTAITADAEPEESEKAPWE